MSEPPRVRPVSLLERVVTTALVPVLLLLGERIPLSHLNAEALGNARAQVSPLAVGLAPFITAYGLVELVALVIPPWRRWRHEAQGRLRLERWAGALAIALAVAQSYGIALSFEAMGIATTMGWETRLVHMATLVGGACAMALAARWATRRGLVNGYVLWWTLPVVIDLARGAAFREAAIRGGGRDVALLAVAMAVAVAATVVAVTGGDAIAAAVRADDTAYRGGPTSAPRPWFPIPASSLQPITFAAAVLMFPAVLANLSIPRMRELQAVLQRGDLLFEAVYVTLVAVATFVAVALLYRPAEVSAFLRRLGTPSDETARADTSSALRRAMPPTLVYLLVLVVASRAAHSKANAVPAVVTLALATGALVDLVRSIATHARARDLVCVTQLHDAYAVAALRAALLGEGIDVRPRGMAVLSLLQAFGPYAPVELYVHEGDSERASALLRHWAAGEGRPVASPASVRRGEPVPWSPGKRALALAILGAVALGVALTPRAAVAGLPAKRAEIALVRVDDAVDPLKGTREDDAPDGVAVFAAVVPLGENHRENRAYARISLRQGESTQAAWMRFLPWLRRFPLPAGERWAWEPQMDVDDTAHDDGALPRFHVVGLKSLVLAGEPAVTTADVEDAEVGWDERSMSPPYVLVTMTPAAGERFYRLTEEWIERRIAIVIDDHVDSAPVIRAPIRGGRVTVTMGHGEPDAELADARRLAASLRAR